MEPRPPLTLLAGFACAWLAGGSPAQTPPAEARTLRLSDGVHMTYLDRGSGDPPLVFVHCGNCQRGVWRETLDAFAPSHRVVAMDLAGHGQSTAQRDSWSIGGLGADVAALVAELKLERVVLVGNSMGGPVALEAARRLGRGRVLGVVAVDTLHDVEFSWPDEAFERLLASYERDFAKTCDAAMQRLLPEDAPQAHRDRLRAETCRNDAKAFVALFRTFRGYDMAEALRAAAVPVRAINSKLIPTAVATNRRHEPSFAAALLEGVGHYPQFERPAEFQAQLRRFVDELARAR